jgi:hypothetical protein
MNPTDFWPVLIRTTLVFLLCTYFTRASVPRIFASMAGGAAFMLGNILWDVAAKQMGWWWYPGMGGRSYGPMVGYAGAVSGSPVSG